MRSAHKHFALKDFWSLTVVAVNRVDLKEKYLIIINNNNVMAVEKMTPSKHEIRETL